jgi:hypothetical protein
LIHSEKLKKIFGRLDWSSIKTLPKLDDHNHDELGITEKGFLVHYMNKDTNLIYTVDEYELFNDDSDKNRKIVGLYIPERDEYKIFNEEELKLIAGLNEFGLPKIKDVAAGIAPTPDPE